MDWLHELIWLGIGAASIWLLYWAGWGVPPWAIAQAGLAEHEALVIAERQYAIWTLFNGIDVLIFAGLPIVAGFIGLLANRQSTIENGRNLAIATAIFFFLAAPKDSLAILVFQCFTGL